MDAICSNCGNPVPDGSKFCPECGTKYEPKPERLVCAYCGAELKPTSKFCPNCGKTVGTSPEHAEPQHPQPQEPVCTHCGAQLKATSKFCPKCGMSVAAVSAQDTSAPAKAPADPLRRQAEQRGVKVATPVNSTVNAGQRNQPQPRPQYAPQGQQPKPKKRVKPLAVILPAIAVVLVGAILFTGLVAPGWMKGSGGAKIKSIYSDNSFVEVTMPDYNKETNCVNTVSSMALQAQMNAMLTEEKFYRAVDSGKSIEELRALSQENAEAWERADVLCSASYMMGMALRKAEKNSAYKSTAAVFPPRIVFSNPLVISASALEMDQFDDAKEWAEYITRINDHAKAGSKTAYVAKILKTDVKRAQKAIEMSQAILWGEGESQAHYDSADLTVLQTTKTAGKIAGVVGATIASGGVGASLTGGVLSTGGYIAGGADMIMEVGDTTLQLTLGEDHQVTKKYQEAAAKVAPVIAVVSFANAAANPQAWEKGIDAAGNVRFVVDTAVDMINGKILGIECPLPSDSGIFKLATLPVGENATPEDIGRAADALADMGFDKEAVELALTPQPEGEEPEPTEKPFSEITDEQLEQKLDYTSMTEEDWQAMFKEVNDEFNAEMREKGLLDPEDEYWTYDPFMPIEDFPEEGDELGFDDISNWAKPDMPGEDWGEAEPEGEEETDAYEEETDTYEEETEAVEETEDEYDEIYALVCGTYSCEENYTIYWEDGNVDTDHESYSVEVTRSGAGLHMMVWGEGAYATFDPENMVATIRDDEDIITFKFTVSGSTVRMHGEGEFYDPGISTDYYVLDGVKN